MKLTTPHLAVPRSDEAACQLRFAYPDFTARDAELLKDLQGLIAGRLPQIVEAVYQYLFSFEPTRKALQNEGVTQRLKDAQKEYLLSVVQGPYDACHRGRVIGDIYDTLQVEPNGYLGTFHLYHRILYPLILERYANDAKAVVEHILALDKITHLDMQLGIESHMAHHTAAMEQLRSLNLQIEAASAAKSQFLADLSHEFRTPLNAIIGFTEVLQDQIPGPVNEEQMEYLGYIHDGGQHLLRLISDVLDLAKVEAGRLNLFYETFPIAQAIHESLTALLGEAEKKRLWLRAQLPANLGLITADHVRFRQILYNLLSNAIKFTPEGGVDISTHIEGNKLHLAIADTGVGIANADRNRIFIEFSQLNPAQQEGTGLGLVLTKRLIEAHGGEIGFESEPGKGSVFHVFLPLQPPLGKPSTTSTNPETGSAGEGGG
jgi:signal transduction histidine kinase